MQAIPFTQQDDGNLPAARRQFSGGHKTVPAIVTPPGHHHDRPFLDEVHRGFGNGLTSTQHQRETGSTPGNGKLIGALHFSCGKNFHCQIRGTNALS